MNRSKFFFRTLVVSLALGVGLQFFNSCKKDDPVPTIKDVVNSAPAQVFQTMVTEATSLATLPAPFKAAAAAITEIVTPAQVTRFSSFDIGSFVSQSPVEKLSLKSANIIFDIEGFASNIVISPDEKTKLKANDKATFVAVISRMLSLPSVTSTTEIDALLAGMRADEEINKYLLKTTGSASDLYEGNYYQGALDVQAFMRDKIIPTLNKIKALRGNLTTPLTQEQQKEFALLILINLQNMNIQLQAFIITFTQLHIGG